MRYEFKYYAVCLCGKFTCKADFGESDRDRLWFLDRACCPICGRDKYTWKIKPLRKVRTPNPNKCWYKPWTWGSICSVEGQK